MKNYDYFVFRRKNQNFNEIIRIFQLKIINDPFLQNFADILQKKSQFVTMIFENSFKIIINLNIIVDFGISTVIYVWYLMLFMIKNLIDLMLSVFVPQKQKFLACGALPLASMAMLRK